MSARRRARPISSGSGLDGSFARSTRSPGPAAGPHRARCRPRPSVAMLTAAARGRGRRRAAGRRPAPPLRRRRRPPPPLGAPHGVAIMRCMSRSSFAARRSRARCRSPPARRTRPGSRPLSVRARQRVPQRRQRAGSVSRKAAAITASVSLGVPSSTSIVPLRDARCRARTRAGARRPRQRHGAQEPQHPARLRQRSSALARSVGSLSSSGSSCGCTCAHRVSSSLRIMPSVSA